MALELRYIDTREMRISLARPFLPAPVAHGQKRLLKPRHQTKPVAPVGRWRCIQAQIVVPRTVAQHQVHFAQGQSRNGAQFIGPDHRAMANYQLRLRKQLVHHPAVGLAPGKVQPRHIDIPVRRPAYIQGRAVDIKLVELARQHRLRRQRDQDARQAQGFATLIVQQADVGQLERRDHASGMRGNGFDTHRHPQHTRGGGFKLRAKLADSRHNQQMQGAPSRREQKPCKKHQRQGPTGNESAGLQ